MNTRKLTLMAMLVAIAVIGASFVSIPTGVARIFPIQHAVNVIAAVTLGPVGAVLTAFVTGLVRLLTGTGSLLAFPGGMIGALLAGFVYWKTNKLRWTILGEVIGTGIIASLLAVPYAAIFMGSKFGVFFFLPAFFLSSLVGSAIGGLILRKVPLNQVTNQELTR
ncbi:energy coupling factor transporter S component ThiW [Mangrovibacillus cuniculi]|uniref:Energy coupling factor transporter S component ThiW n=1 Tax=Mangrovibacillus cuniculi TaxID=2593652 RepID=A0A7S8CCS0_9BACI|nr:energy coupling factor transporter S component ThiW [Mangrovibacillus cuniculi]QPC47583.1 energy coupling factor transporter S component ThiW [Mangrovibacillus cuniculi]